MVNYIAPRSGFSWGCGNDGELGNCVVAIAMRNQFDWGELPHETPFRSAPSDISSFQKLYQGVLEINAECASKNGQPGWYQSGKHPTTRFRGTLATLGLIMFSSSLGDLSSIAVFIWQSGSEINERIKGSVGGGSGSSSLIATG